MNARIEARPVGVQDWNQRNQRWLAARLSALRQTLQSRIDEAAPESVAAPAMRDEPDDDFEPALLVCAQRFGLSPFERDLLLLAAGVELDLGLRAFRDERLGGALSFQAALSLLDDAHWSAIGPAAPLRHWQLLHWPGADAASDAPRVHAPLVISERVLHF